MLPASSPDHPERQARRALIRGVYAITADEGDTTRLLADVEAALSGGIRILQYRNKHADRALKRQQLEALKPVCARHQTLLIVNDDWRSWALMPCIWVRTTAISRRPVGRWGPGH